MAKWWNRLTRVDEKRWEKFRRLGFFGFVMVWGIAAFGMTTGILSVSALLALEGIDRLQEEWGWWGLIGRWLLGVGAFAGGGFRWSAVMWWSMEWMYKRQLRKSGREPTPPGTGDPDAG